MNTRQAMILRYMMLNTSTTFDYIHGSQGGEVSLIYYYGDRSVIRVPKAYMDTPITSIEPSCFTANSEVTTVIIPEGVTQIL